MCLAIYKPKGVTISKKYLHNGYTENRDGSGFAFASHGRIQCFKGFETFHDFWKAIKPLQAKHSMLIHFRFATHGDKSTTNVHPILIDGGRYAVIHNGVIQIKTHGTWSDTVTFANHVLAPCFKRFSWKDATLKYLIETSIGSGNKVLAMNRSGDVVIYNEASGHWHNGAWYSNHGYEGTSRWQSLSCYASDVYHNWKSGYTPSAHYKQTVFDEIDEDELAAETLQTYGITNGVIVDKDGNVDGESLDYDGTSAHKKPLIPLHYLQDHGTELHLDGDGNVTKIVTKPPKPN